MDNVGKPIRWLGVGIGRDQAMEAAHKLKIAGFIT